MREKKTLAIVSWDVAGILSFKRKKRRGNRSVEKKTEKNIARRSRREKEMPDWNLGCSGR